MTLRSDDTWSGVIAVEGTTTLDGRQVDVYGFHWEGLPLPLREGDGGQTIGTVDEIHRDGRLIRASGTFTQEHGPHHGLGVDVTHASFEEIDGVTYLHNGRIRQVWLESEHGPAWPECQFDDKEAGS